MTPFKNWWQGLKYWQKGMFIAFMVGILNGLIVIAWIISDANSRDNPIWTSLISNNIANHPLDLAINIVNFYGCVTSPCILHAIVVSLIIYGLIGIAIGFIYQGIKNLLKN